MTPADKRMLELLDRWLSSIELHLKYADLDEASYRQVQPWPVHDRPARWILELAQQKVLQLKTLCKAQIATHDPVLSEALELMAFLANLVGAQNIDRFIPLADPASERTLAAETKTASLSTARVNFEKSVVPVLNNAQDQGDATRELPKLKIPQQRTTAAVEETREMPKLKVPARTPVKESAKKFLEKPLGSTTQAQELVVADAVRLLKWGKEWHELAESIARIAERPAIAEVRRILRTSKPQIETQLERLTPPK